MTEDPRLADARKMDICTIAEKLDIPGLTKGRTQWVGPCPRLGCGGTDRFSIDRRKGLYNCRHCGGGDVIRLVEVVLGCDFKAALDWLCGPSQEISEEDRRARAKEEERRRIERDRREEQERRRAIARGRRIWSEGNGAALDDVRAYLSLRGIPDRLIDPLPRCLRAHPDLPYMHRRPDGDDFMELHRGPAMLAAVQKSNGRAEAVHRTWIDLDRPNGKALVLHPVLGDALPAKKIEGSKRGGAIRLTGSLSAPVLVMGEGIETTLSAMAGWDGPPAMFWAGVDLGNMAGRMQSGPGLKYAGIPDMTDDGAFLPPPWVQRLIFVMDGDSEPRLTEAKLQAGLRRAMACIPGLRGQIARAPKGMDLNDVLMRDSETEDADANDA